MATHDEIPVPLTHLIAYVRALHPNADVLEHLADASSVAASLDEQSDALLDHFVKEARDAGATWSQIGGTMGVTKQAVQKRFAARDLARDLLPEGQALFSRFPPRARCVILSAWGRAAADGRDTIEPADIVAGLLTQPNGMAAVIIHELGVSDRQIAGVVGEPGAEPVAEASDAALEAVAFSMAGVAAMKATLKEALRLGHNYIGTEHMLLGVLTASEIGEQLVKSGLTPERVKALLVEKLVK